MHARTRALTRTPLVLSLLCAGLAVVGCRPVSESPSGTSTAPSVSESTDDRTDRPTVVAAAESPTSGGRPGAPSGGETVAPSGPRPGMGADAARSAEDPGGAWDEPPPCRNRPLSAEEWIAAIESNRTVAAGAFVPTTARRAVGLLGVPREAGAPREVLRRWLAADAGGDHLLAVRRQRAALALNIASGRLNRRSALARADDGQGEMITAGAIFDRLSELQPDAGSAGVPATALPAEPTDTERTVARARRFLDADEIARHVCARVLYRTGDHLHEAIWSNRGISRTDHRVTELPPGVTDVSPDGEWMIVQAVHGDTGGGSLVVYDLREGRSHALDPALERTPRSGVSNFGVAGWLPSADHVLLVDEDAGRIAWLDLTTHETAPLASYRAMIGDREPRAVDLAPDGSGFVFAARDLDTEGWTVHWVDLDDGTSREVVDVPPEMGHVARLSVAPDGERAVAVLEHGTRATGRHQSLHLITMVTGDIEPLAVIHAKAVDPVWSPDLDAVAFRAHVSDGPVVAGTDAARADGDLWTLSIPDGRLARKTDLGTVIGRPRWTSSGEHLAFVTSDGEIGLTAVGPERDVWLVDRVRDHPHWLHLEVAP